MAGVGCCALLKNLVPFFGARAEVTMHDIGDPLVVWLVARCAHSSVQNGQAVHFTERGSASMV